MQKPQSATQPISISHHLSQSAPAVDDRGGAVAAAAGRLADAARQGLIGLPAIATAVFCGNMAQ